MLPTSLAEQAVLIVLASALYCVVSNLFQSKTSVQALPVPLGAQWIWGHERTVFVREPGRAFRGWIREKGLTFRIKAAFRAPDVVVLSDPVGIAHILQKKVYDYPHSQVVRPRVARLLGKGLGWVEGETEHKRMRHMVTPPFSHENIRAMSQDIAAASMQIVDDLTLEVQGSSKDSSYNALEWTAKATLNVIGRVVFLHDFEGGNSEDAKLILNARRRGVNPVLQYAGFLTLMLLRRFPILNKLPIWAIQSQGLAKMVIQSGVAYEMIRRNEGLVGNIQPKQQRDLLTRLLSAHAEGRISRQELLEQISTFVISGHETTTQTLGFTIFELARHPDIQRRLRAELAELGREPTYDDFHARLPYLDAVLKETLRLYPGLPYMERTAACADIIPLRDPVQLSTGQLITALPVAPGQVVLIPIIAIHRLDAVWKDADTFRPERWLHDLPASESLCNGWANTLAFSDGPRSCIGMRLAIYQYKVILTQMMGRFRFVDSGADIMLKVSSSLQAWDACAIEKGPCIPVRLELL
uniref:Cytochrome P450 n=1 Tax=Rhodonia placenta TaxID=104341 RepID=F1SY61_9APHY|nr:cytochrome P450 [Postia placenta]